MVGGPNLPPSYINVCKIRRLCRAMSSLVFDKLLSNYCRQLYWFKAFFLVSLTIEVGLRPKKDTSLIWIFYLELYVLVQIDMDPFIRPKIWNNRRPRNTPSLWCCSIIKLSNLTGDFSLNTQLCVENRSFFRPKIWNNRRLQIPRGKYSVYLVLHKVRNLTGVQ